MVAQTQIVARWSEMTLKHSHSTLTCNAVPFAETRAEISRSEGSCIYQHLLLKNLVFDPITQIILENEPYGWSSNEEGDPSQQSDDLGSTLAGPMPVEDYMLTNGPGLDADLTSLQVEVLAFQADVESFIQQHGGTRA